MGGKRLIDSIWKIVGHTSLFARASLLCVTLVLKGCEASLPCFVKWPPIHLFSFSPAHNPLPPFLKKASQCGPASPPPQNFSPAVFSISLPSCPSPNERKYPTFEFSLIRSETRGFWHFLRVAGWRGGAVDSCVREKEMLVSQRGRERFGAGL